MCSTHLTIKKANLEIGKLILALPLQLLLKKHANISGKYLLINFPAV